MPYLRAPRLRCQTARALLDTMPAPVSLQSSSTIANHQVPALEVFGGRRTLHRDGPRLVRQRSVRVASCAGLPSSMQGSRGGACFSSQAECEEMRSVSGAGELSVGHVSGVDTVRQARAELKDGFPFPSSRFRGSWAVKHSRAGHSVARLSREGPRSELSDTGGNGKTENVADGRAEVRGAPGTEEVSSAVLANQIEISVPESVGVTVIDENGKVVEGWGAKAMGMLRNLLGSADTGVINVLGGWRGEEVKRVPALPEGRADGAEMHSGQLPSAEGTISRLNAGDEGGARVLDTLRFRSDSGAESTGRENQLVGVSGHESETTAADARSVIVEEVGTPEKIEGGTCTVDMVAAANSRSLASSFKTDGDPEDVSFRAESLSLSSVPRPIESNTEAMKNLVLKLEIERDEGNPVRSEILAVDRSEVTMSSSTVVRMEVGEEEGDSLRLPTRITRSELVNGEATLSLKDEVKLESVVTSSETAQDEREATLGSVANKDEEESATPESVVTRSLISEILSETGSRSEADLWHDGQTPVLLCDRKEEETHSAESLGSKVESGVHEWGTVEPKKTLMGSETRNEKEAPRLGSVSAERWATEANDTPQIDVLVSDSNTGIQDTNLGQLLGAASPQEGAPSPEKTRFPAERRRRVAGSLQKQPTELHDLLTVPGIGPRNMEKFIAKGILKVEELKQLYRDKFRDQKEDKMVEYLRSSIGIIHKNHAMSIASYIKETVDGELEKEDSSGKGENGIRQKRRLTFCVEGNISVGKTTFLQKIANETLELRDLVEVVPEPVGKWQDIGPDHFNILNAFYEEPQRYAYTFQNYVFVTRFMQERESAKGLKPLRLMERSVFSDRMVFVRAVHEAKWMSEMEISIYDSWFDPVVSALPGLVPDAFIYMRASPDTCHRRLQMRKRPEEQTVTLEYLRGLHEKHEQWLFPAERPERNMFSVSEWPRAIEDVLPSRIKDRVFYLQGENVHSCIQKVPALVLDCEPNIDFSKDLEAKAEYARQVAEFFEYVQRVKGSDGTENPNKPSPSSSLVLPGGGGLLGPDGSLLRANGIPGLDLRGQVSSFC